MPNRLIHEKSPYLLQHAHNPVDWYPWGEAVFQKAKEEDKPIFLSIGYATCHWCHVMEQESFEDKTVAQLINETFIPIKVDREERPDIDHIYMEVCQKLTGSGGWPLTIFMTPHQQPFFAGTYFPKEDRFGRVGMISLVPHIKKLWQGERTKILQSASQITEMVQASPPPPQQENLLREETLHLAYQQLDRLFDEQFSGFGHAPKFPTPHQLLFLLRYWKRTSNPRALAMVEKTLTAMRLGGIFDQIGFGFHRYATDAHWLVPHFEKMLYDQAMLALAYTEAFQATQKPFYRAVAEEIFIYVLRDMRGNVGGFYSAEDADSEGIEGKFYLWEEKELKQILGEKGTHACSIWQVSSQGNFTDEATGKQHPANILHLTQPLSSSEQSILEPCRAQLFAVRENRIHPLKDDKILTDWNGLMIAALAKAGAIFQKPDYLEAAIQTTTFILETMKTPEGMLWHRFREGEAAIPAHLDDYAFLIWGLLELYEATFSTHYLEQALHFNQKLLDHFWDEPAGGFYFTSYHHEKLLTRPKPIYDGAIPSGNSVAMLNLLRLARLTGKTEFEKKANQLATAFSSHLAHAPMAFTQFMMALDFALGPTYEIILVGDLHQASTQEMQRALHEVYLPNKVVLFSAPQDQKVRKLVPFLAPYPDSTGVPTAYLCQNHQCMAPTTDPQTFRAQLNTTR